MLTVHVKTLFVQTGLRMKPWRSFWECLWVASPIEFSHDSESTDGDQDGEPIRQLSHKEVVKEHKTYKRVMPKAITIFKHN